MLQWVVRSLVATMLLAGAGCAAPSPADIGTVTRPGDGTVQPASTGASSPAPTAYASPAPGLAPSPDAREPFVEARVVEVVDGDTIRVALGGQVYPVRYIGIDAPEWDSRDDRLRSLAVEATAVNASLLAGGTVRLERDVSEVDRFGRLLRYVWVGDMMVNGELVRLGVARAATYRPDVKHQAVLSELQQRAQAARLGLWSSTQPVALENATLRAGPGTFYERVGSVEGGQELDVVARNEAGDWLQLASGDWIAARLVGGPPGNAVNAGALKAQQVELVTPAPSAGAKAPSVEIIDLFRDGEKGPAEPDEYVEIQNLGAEPQDMTGWRLESERRQGDAGQVFLFPDGLVMQPGQKCRIYTNEDHPESCGLTFGRGAAAIWHNSQPDAALLFDPAGNLVSRRQ